MSIPPSPSRKPRVAIIGAGVVGLSIAWRLARAGCAVDLYDKGGAGHAATRAAAGMLAAGVEAEPGEQRLLPLCLESRRMWPAFAAELEAASGMDVGLRRDGTLVTAATRDDLALLRTTFEFQRGLGLELRWLTAAEALEREPFLSPRTTGAVFSPEDGQVDNRAVAAALILAATRAGATIHEGFAVDAIEVAGGRALGPVVEGVQRRADVTVLAAGAWSKTIPGLPVGALPPVRPVKGQMLALTMDPAAPLLRHVLWAPKCYLVPRVDGRLIVGATTEERGFDDSLTAGGLLALLDAAWRAVPAIEELPMLESWAGFRPGSRDDAPILGPVADVEGLVLATGHHRNGILLAPVTAETIADFIITGRIDPRIAAFGVDRFAPSRRAAE